MLVKAPQITRSTPYDDLPQWLSAQEAAAVLGVTTWAIYQNIHQGHIPYRRVGPKIIQIPKDYFNPDRAKQQVTT
jgi:excisionase family DNA binding protein